MEDFRPLRPPRQVGLRCVRFTSETFQTPFGTVVRSEETWESRRISASYASGGPLTSPPTTQSHPVSATRLPGTTLLPRPRHQSSKAIMDICAAVPGRRETFEERRRRSADTRRSVAVSPSEISEETMANKVVVRADTTPRQEDVDASYHRPEGSPQHDIAHLSQRSHDSIATLAKARADASSLRKSLEEIRRRRSNDTPRPLAGLPPKDSRSTTASNEHTRANISRLRERLGQIRHSSSGTRRPAPLSERPYNTTATRHPYIRTPPPLPPQLTYQDENLSPVYTSTIAMHHKDSLDLPAAKLVPKLPQDEMEPRQSPTPRPKPSTGIPRARTLNVLSNLTASMSRTSLSLSTRGSQRKASRASRNTSGSSTTTQNSLIAPLGPAGGGMASGLATSIPNTNFDDDSVFPTPQRDPRYIYEAQSSEHWTGRYMALNDRFMSESLPDEITNSPERSDTSPAAASPPVSPADSLTELTPTPRPSLHSQRQRGSDTWLSTRPAPIRSTSLIPHLGTMPSLRHDRRATLEVPAIIHDEEDISTSLSKDRNRATLKSRVAALEDEDARAKRVFRHLEAMCKTTEARRSLFAWQQVFARRMNKEHLLPSGGSMEDRGWVGRLLSNSSSVGKGLVYASPFGRRKRDSLLR